MLQRVRIEAFIKGIFMFLAVTIVMLILGARLYQGYDKKFSDVVSHAEQLKVSIEHSLDPDGNAPYFDELTRFMTPSTYAEAPDLIVHDQQGREYLYVVNRTRILAELIEEDRYILLVGILGLLVAVELAIFLAYFITGPLRNLAWGCKEIGRGKNIRIVQNIFTPYELQELTESFNEMAAQLEYWRNVQRQISRMDRLAALGEMLSGLSHEIRNPLASMNIRLDLLRQDIESKKERVGPTLELEENLQHIDVLQGEVDRLNNTVSQLLSFVRVQEAIRAEVGLQDLAEWCQSMFQNQAEKIGVTFVTKCIQPDVVVWADRDQIQQALTNLVINALQAMSGGDAERKKILEVRTDHIKERGTGKETGELIVRDTGPGISEELQHRIFDPFFTTKSEGTGLGLSIVNRIVSAHMGSLKLESSSDGTEFRISLPLAERKK